MSASINYLRLLQFTAASMNACLDPIWSLFLQNSLHFSNADIGFVFGFGPLSAFAGSLFWSKYAQGNKKRSAVIFMTLSGFATLLSLALLVQVRPRILTRTTVAVIISFYNFVNSGGKSSLCSLFYTIYCRCPNVFGQSGLGWILRSLNSWVLPTRICSVFFHLLLHMEPPQTK